MNRKIVAIGGGQTGKKIDGIRVGYETSAMDQEIVKLTDKENPHFLFIAHSQKDLEAQMGYFNGMKELYEEYYHCECRTLISIDLDDYEKAKEYTEWADIIYEGGGDTMSMIALWKRTGFDQLLREAWTKGTVMCGVSAGANCWFDACSTDSLRIQKNDPTLPLTSCDCLGFITGFFVPHCDEPGRIESSKEILKENGMVGIFVSNCAALEIVDDKYRLITTDASAYGISSYALKVYWKEGECIEEPISISSEFKDIEELLSISSKRIK